MGSDLWRRLGVMFLGLWWRPGVILVSFWVAGVLLERFGSVLGCMCPAVRRFCVSHPYAWPTDLYEDGLGARVPDESMRF